MAYRNGYLPASALSRIPGGRLRKDAARAWNAMRAESLARYGHDIRPLGPNSSYRTYAQQVQMKRIYGSNAATPGTSNHGWGLAVDLNSRKTRWVVDQIGAKYGWAKRWSDASWEWWHLKWKPGRYAAVARHRRSPTLRYRSSGPAVKRLQRLLRSKGYKSVAVTGYYGVATRKAVWRFQKKKGMRTDGVCGPATWARLRR